MRYDLLFVAGSMVLLSTAVLAAEVHVLVGLLVGSVNYGLCLLAVKKVIS